MKNFLIVLGLFAFAVTLAGCGNSEEKNDTTTPATGLEVQTETTADETPVKKLSDIEDYQMRFTMESMDPTTQQKSSMDVSVYKKGGSLAYVFNSMDAGTAETPFVPKKILVTNNTAYTQFDQDGELTWLSMPAEEEQFASSIFDFSTIEESIQKEATDTKDETINGEAVTCYYKKDTMEDSKVCLKDGIIYSMESMDPATKMTTKMQVTEYTTEVTADVFTAPENAMSMEEFSAKMMQDVLGSGADLENINMENTDAPSIPQ